MPAPALQHLSPQEWEQAVALTSSQEPQEPASRSFCISSARTGALEPWSLRRKDAVPRGVGVGAHSRLHPDVFRLQATASLRREEAKEGSAGERPRGTSAAGEAPTECERD